MSNSQSLTVHEQITDILQFLGRRQSEGEVKGDHLSKILNYLIQQGSEDYGKTVAKLSLLCGIGQRYIRENYLDGLEAFNIIKVTIGGNLKTWVWQGLPKKT